MSRTKRTSSLCRLIPALVVAAFATVAGCKSTQTETTPQAPVAPVETKKVNIPDDPAECFKMIVATFDRGYDGEHHLRDSLDRDALKELVDAGIDINARNENGETALMHTTSAEVVKALIEFGADVNAKNAEGETALMIFAHTNCFADSLANMVEETGCSSLYEGTDIDPDADEDVKKAMEEANDENEFDPRDIPCSAVCGKLLIDAGADINARDNENHTALMHLRDVEELTDWEDDTQFFIMTLIDNGADANVRDNDGVTPLMLVSTENGARSLIAGGADANAKDNRGRTPLMLVRGDSNIEALIEAGADVKAKDDEGQTVLMYQMYITGERDLNDPIIKRLIKAGADVKAKDKKGRTVKKWN